MLQDYSIICKIISQQVRQGTDETGDAVKQTFRLVKGTNKGDGSVYNKGDGSTIKGTTIKGTVLFIAKAKSLSCLLHLTET